MSVADALTTDVGRVAGEGRTSFFFLVTGLQGSGKTFTLTSVVKELTTAGTGTRTNSFADMLLPPPSPSPEQPSSSLSEKDSLKPASLQVYRLDYAVLRADVERALSAPRHGAWCAAGEGPLALRSGAVVVLDDLEALWTLSLLNTLLPTLKRVLRGVLGSKGCALVASARGLSGVPTAVLEWRRPLVYTLPPLTLAAARKAVHSGFGACDGASRSGGGLVPCAAAVLPSTTHGSLLLALCLARGLWADSDRCEATLVRESLRWLDGAAAAAAAAEEEAPMQEGDGGSTTAAPPTLVGLQALHERMHMLVSVFAAARQGGAAAQAGEASASGQQPCTGQLLAALKGTTGVLLHGPSGCGKSALPRHLAAAFPGVAFFFVKCTSLFSKYLGESEEKLRQVYRRARARAPAVVVLDDVDVIAQSRGAMTSAEDSGGARGGGVNVNKRMLAGLLCELDGVTDNSGVLTIGTTNAPEVIDGALLRQGRLETLVYVPPLTTRAATEMCEPFFAAFEGSAEERAERTVLVARTATGCTPAALRFVLRKLLETCLPQLDDAQPGVQPPLPRPLPSAAAVGGVLFGSAAMLQRTVYTFDTEL